MNQNQLSVLCLASLEIGGAGGDKSFGGSRLILWELLWPPKLAAFMPDQIGLEEQGINLLGEAVRGEVGPYSGFGGSLPILWGPLWAITNFCIHYQDREAVHVRPGCWPGGGRLPNASSYM